MNRPVAGDARTSTWTMRRQLWTQLFLDIVVPLILFYGLRHFGTSVLTASIISGAFPAIRTTVSLLRGRIDLLGIAVVSLFLVGTVIAYLEGDPRFVFAKDGWLTGLLGLWIAISLATRRPFMLQLGRIIATAKRSGEAADVWLRRWEDGPRFRHDIRVVSCVVGVVLMADAVVRVVTAYTVALDALPVVTNVQYVVMLAGLLGWFFPYTAKHGLRA